MGEMNSKVKEMVLEHLKELERRRALRRKASPEEQQRQAGMKVARMAHKKKMDEYAEMSVWEEFSDQ